MSMDLEKVKDSYEKGIQKYVSYKVNSMSNFRPVNNEQIEIEYTTKIDDVIDYLRSLFPNGFIHNEGNITFDLQDMIGSLDPNVGYFLEDVSISGIVKAFEDPLITLTFRNGILVKASNLQKIPKLPRKYRTKFLNSILEGYTIEEIEEFFISEGVLKKNNMLDYTIRDYEARSRDRIDFINCVIMKLLMSGSEEDLTRAYLFDYLMGAQFDFDAYKSKERTK